MKQVSRHPVFSGILVACLAIMVAEGWLVVGQWKLAQSSFSRCEQLRAELRVLNRVIPPLNVHTTAELQAELSEATTVLAGLHAEMKMRGAAGAFTEAVDTLGAADGYFVIAAFVESMREKAKRCGVRVRADERFGFADYTHMGPEERDLPRVLRERHAMELLLDAVYDARPHQLIGVQRERRLVAGDKATAASSSGGTNVRADYFDWDSRASIRQSGLIDTFALRVSFVGQTVSLRVLLNRLAEVESPMVVRAVEVQPELKTVERANEVSNAEPLRPLVSRSLSRFIVTVELMEWIGPPGEQS